MSAPTQQEITFIIAADDHGTRASDFAESIRMETQNIEGTRYKFTLNEAHEIER